MSKHTPGPWMADTEEIGGSFQIYMEGSYLDPWIADAKGTHVGPKSLEEVKANAALIAAAPELLGALQEVMEWISEWDPNFASDDKWPIARDAALAAIAKATS